MFLWFYSPSRLFTRILGVEFKNLSRAFFLFTYLFIFNVAFVYFSFMVICLCDSRLMNLGSLYVNRECANINKPVYVISWPYAWFQSHTNPVLCFCFVFSIKGAWDVAVVLHCFFASVCCCVADNNIWHLKKKWKQEVKNKCKKCLKEVKKITQECSSDFFFAAPKIAALQ